MRAPHDRTSIENVLKRLRASCGHVDALVQVMDDEKIDETLQIQYQKQLIVALKYLDKWANDGHEQVHEILVARGAFNVGGAEVAQKKGRRVLPKTESKKKAKKPAKKTEKKPA